MGLCSRCLMERLFDPPGLEEKETEAGSFITVREVARGGMGNVVEVHDRSLKRSVAMKVMRDDARVSANARLRFRREAEVLARLEHPNIVPIHEQGEDPDGRPFYTMKLVKGRTLRAILDDLKAGKVAAYLDWNLDGLLNVYRKVGDAIGFAHSRGIVHRDLKPDNIMVGEFGEVLVMDWGLAKLLDDAEGEAECETIIEDPGIDLGNLPVKDSSVTLDGAVLGTPQFMPPEQAAGRMSQIDARADVFSLGAILYNILTLRPPIRGDSVEEVLEKVRTGSFEAPTHFNPTQVRKRRKDSDEAEHTTLTRNLDGKLKHCPGGRIPESLSAVTMRAMEFEREERYQSVADLMDDIVAYQRGFATSVEQIGTLGQLWLLIMRHRVVSTLSALMLVISGIFVFKLMASEERSRLNAKQAAVEASNAKSAKTRAEQEAANAKEAEAVAKREKEATRIALAKARIALAEASYRTGDANALLRHLEECPKDLRDSNWRYLRDESDREVRQIDALVNRSIWNCPPIPGTQSRFVTIDNGGFVWDVNAATGVAHEKFRTPLRGRVFVDVNRKADQLIIAQQGTSRFSVIRFDSGETLLSGSVPDGKIELVKFSPDGAFLLARSASPYVLHCLNAQTCEPIWSTRQTSRQVALSPESKLVAMSGSDPETIELRALVTGDVRQRLTHAGITRVNRLVFSPDGRHLAIGDMSGNVLVWQVDNGRLVRQFKAGNGRVQTLQVTRAGFLIVSTGADDISIGKKLQVFALASGSRAETQLGIRPQAIEGILHPDSGHLIFTGQTPSVWRIGDGRETLGLLGTRVPVSVGFLGEKHVFATSPNRGMALFNVAVTNSPITAWRAGDPMAALLSVSHDVTHAVAAFAKSRSPGFSRLKLAADGGVVEHGRIRMPWLVVYVALSSDGQRMLSALRDGRVVETELDSESHRTILDARRGITKMVAYVADARFITVSKGQRGAGKECDCLELWNLETGQRETKVDLEFVVNDLAVDATGRKIAVVGDDWRVHLFGSDSLASIRSFRAHDQRITSVAFHPALPVLATGSTDLAIKLWDHQAGTLLDRYLGSRHAPLDLAFSASGGQLVVGSGDKRTRVYETKLFSESP